MPRVTVITIKKDAPPNPKEMWIEIKGKVIKYPELMYDYYREASGKWVISYVHPEGIELSGA